MPLRFPARLLGGLTLLTLVTALPASAQMRTERVRFDPGEIEARYTPRIARGASVRYLVSARRGQILSAETGVANEAPQVCTMSVYAPGRAIRPANAAPNELGERLNVSSWSGTLSRAGDYQIVVTNTGPTGECPFRLAVE